jgi:hypothetical protein
VPSYVVFFAVGMYQLYKGFSLWYFCTCIRTLIKFTSSVTLSYLSSPFYNNIRGFHYSIFIHVYKVFHTVSPLHNLLSPFSLLLVLTFKQSPFYTCVTCYVFRSRFCICERACDICLSRSGWFYLIWWSLVLSIFLQMTQFSSLWMNNTPCCIYTPYFLYSFICSWVRR